MPSGDPAGRARTPRRPDRAKRPLAPAADDRARDPVDRPGRLPSAVRAASAPRRARRKPLARARCWRSLTGVAVLVLPLGLACAAILAAYLVSMGLDAETVALSPFGPSQSGRFYGINNLLETMLLAPSLVGAALLGRWGIGVAALAFVTIGGNRFGADGGGIVVLAAAYLVLLLRLREHRPTLRLAAAVAAGAIAIALLLLGLDAATGGSSHVTDAVGDGPVALARRHRRPARARPCAAPRRASGPPPSCSARSRSSPRLRCGPAAEPVLDAFLAGLAVSLVVNDTPGDVLGMGAAIAIALARHPPRRVPLSLPSMRRAATLARADRPAGGRCRLRRRRGSGAAARDASRARSRRRRRASDTEEPTTSARGRCGERREHLRLRRLRRLPRARSSRVVRHVGPNLDDSKPDFALVVDRVTNGRGRDALVRGPAERAGNRRRRTVRRRVDRADPSHPTSRVDVAAIACDLDRTLICAGRRPAAAHDRGDRRRPRGRHPRADRDRPHVPLGAAVRAGGRDRGSARLLPGRRGRRAGDRRVPPARADPARARARGDRGRAGRGLRAQLLRRRRALRRGGDRRTPARTPTSSTSRSPRSATCSRGSSGRRRSSSSSSTPEELDALRPTLVARFGDRLFIAKSLPHFLELASPAISKGSGLAFVAEHLGFTAAQTVAFGDGENDRELLAWAGYGVCVENGDDGLKELADWICPGAEEEGVAQAIEAFLDSRA